tara:strand:+ start:213 stop:551 length:339 start_codon:yes stop_codon:yes gene_type:complete
MLVGAATAPPEETLVLEGVLLPPEEVPPPPLDEGLLAVIEEVGPPPLLVGAGPLGAGALILGVSIFKLAGIPVIEMDLPNAKDPNLPGIARVRIESFKAVSLRFPDNAFTDS